VGLESVSEPDLDRDQEEDEDGEDGAFFSNSPSPAPPSPAPPSTEDSSSLDLVTSLSAHQPDAVHDIEPQEGLDDEEEWVNPSPPPPHSRITSNGLSVDFNSLKENNKGKAKARKTNASPSPTPPQHFPFPSSDDNDEPNSVGNVLRGARDRGETRPPPHIRSIRARNGGRTQSGGVKGVWKDGGDDEF
jgi:cysteine protease ATG4